MMAGLRRLWRLVAVLVLITVGRAWAHPMDQVRASFSSDGSGWEASVWIEAWALYPEDGPKAVDRIPGMPDSWGRDWVESLDEGDHLGMRGVQEEFVRDSFRLTLSGRRLDFACRFPDYGAGGYATVLENEDGNAMFRIDLEGRFPEAEQGPLELVWNDEAGQPLTLQLRISAEETEPVVRLLRIAAEDDPVELMVVEGGGEVSEGDGFSLLGWIVAGFEHILPKGLDHILFILGLFLLEPKVRPLLWQSGAFTVAHSITLAMVVLGVFTVPGRIVEAMIALSIAYVALENLWVTELKPRRVALVFALGLLHGMGFASVMRELELPDDGLIEPLIGFNLGVEAGQLAVLAAAFAVSAAFLKSEGFRTARKVASGGIAVVGLYWTVERLAG